MTGNPKWVPISEAHPTDDPQIVWLPHSEVAISAYPDLTYAEDGNTITGFGPDGWGMTDDGDKIALELNGSKSITESFDLVIHDMTDREVKTSSGGDLWKMTIETDKKRVSRY